MPKIPLMDYIGRPLLACMFLALLWLQWRFPLRRLHFFARHRGVRSDLSSLRGLVLGGVPSLRRAVAVGTWEGDRRVGCIHCRPVAAWAIGVARLRGGEYHYWRACWG